MKSKITDKSAIAVLLFMGVVCGTTALTATSPLLYETFQEIPEGAIANGSVSGNADWAVAGVSGSGRYFEIHKDTTGIFGQGSDFQYLEATKDNVTGTLSMTAVNAFTPSEVVTVSFLYYEQNASPTLPFSLYYGKDSLGGSDLNLAGYIQLEGGTLYGKGGIGGSNTASYSATANPIRIDLVLNNGSAGYTYDVDGDSYQVDSQRFDVWIDGILIANNLETNLSRSYTGGISSVRVLYNSSNAENTVLLGEFGVFEGAVINALIPEPGLTGILVSGLLVGGFLLSKRRRTA